MRKAKDYVARLKNRMMLRMAGVKPEMESGDQLVEILGIIAIACVLLFLFKDQLIKIFNNMIAKSNTQMDTLFEAATPPPTTT